VCVSHLIQLTPQHVSLPLQGFTLSGDKGLSSELLLLCKQQGFSDLQIGLAVGADEMAVRAARKAHGILPVVKQVRI